MVNGPGRLERYGEGKRKGGKKLAGPVDSEKKAEPPCFRRKSDRDGQNFASGKKKPG